MKITKVEQLKEGMRVRGKENGIEFEGELELQDTGTWEDYINEAITDLETVEEEQPVEKQAKHKYKVGDKVRVRKDLKVNTSHGFFFNEEMGQKIGEVVTIKSVGEYFYKIYEDAYIWSGEMFEGLADQLPELKELKTEEELRGAVGKMVRFVRVGGSQEDKDGVLRLGHNKVSVYIKEAVRRQYFSELGNDPTYRIYLLEEKPPQLIPISTEELEREKEKTVLPWYMWGIDKADGKGDVTGNITFRYVDGNEFIPGSKTLDSLLITEYATLNTKKDSLFNILKNKTMSLISKVREMARKEPDKSLIKYGLMNEDNEITQEGQTVLIDFLFNQNKEEIKKTYIDPIIEETEKTTKKK